MNTSTNKQKNKLYFFFSLICVFILSVCFIRKYDGYHTEDARFANYIPLGNDQNGLAYYCDSADSDKIAVAIGTCTATSITVNTYDGKPVTDVYPSGFQNCSNVKTIKLPDSIETLGTDAFAGSGLESITIPNGLEVISSGAFRNCRNLTAVTFKTGNNVKVINDYAFANDYNLSSFAFHKITNLTTIGKEAFLYCLGLRSIIFPNGFKTLESYAFHDCKGLTTIYFPSSTAYVDANAFRGVGGSAKIYFSEDDPKNPSSSSSSSSSSAPATSITPVSLAEDFNFSYGDYYIPVVYGVGEMRFEGPFRFTRPANGEYILNLCTDSNGSNWTDTKTEEFREYIAEDEVILVNYDDDGETTDLNIPSTILDGAFKVVGIQPNVFFENETIQSVTFNENLRFIDYKAFEGCTHLTNIDFTKAVDLEHIQSRAFYNAMPVDTTVCDNSDLYTVHIPSNVVNIGADAFRNCRGLFKLYFDGATNRYEETIITDGVKKTFDLPFTPTSVERVTLAGPALTANTDFTWSGKTVTLTNVPVKQRTLKITYTTDATTTQTFIGHLDEDDPETDFVLSGKAEAIASVTVEGAAKTSGTDYTTSLVGDGDNKKTKITFATAPAIGDEIVVSYRALSKLEKIDNFAFSGCADLYGDLSFYGLKLMYHDDAFQKVYFPASLTTIGANAFASAQFVGGAVFASNNLTIGSKAFLLHKCLSSIVFKTDMSSLTLNAYSFAFAETLNNANYAAGDQFKKLISVTLPSGTTVSGNNVFYGHILLSIYCIDNEPNGHASYSSWNAVGSKVVAAWGDFSTDATQNEMDKAPFYLVDDVEDIVTLPNSYYPVFEFVKEHGSETATLTKYHYYGGRIKDANGDTAIKPGKSLSTTTPGDRNSTDYASDYAQLLSNAHFRGNIPAQVLFDDWTTVAKIGPKALACQMNTSSLNPKNDTSQYEKQNTQGRYYWLDSNNFFTMRELYVPDTITEIGDAAMAFVPFVTLKSYTMSDATTSGDGKAQIWDGDGGDGTFGDGVFPHSLLSIGKLAFTFSGIGKASIPDCLTYFGGISSTAAPTDTSFYSFPFMGCFDLADLSLYESDAPSNVFTAGGGVINYNVDGPSKGKMIEGAEGKSEIKIPWGTTTTVAGALRGGRNISTIYFPYTLTGISNFFLDVIGSARDSHGRSGTSALVNVYFGNAQEYEQSSAIQSTVTAPACVSIGTSAFWGCRKLRNVELPISLTSLSNKVFKECTTLDGFSIDYGTESEPPYDKIEDDDPMGSVFDCTKLTNLTSIGEECFMNAKAITGVITSERITELKKNTFSGATALETATIDSATASIKDTCFTGCNHLQTATFGGPVNLGTSAFSGCSALATVTFGGATTFGTTCFNNCTSLKRITIPEGSVVGSKSFNGCTGLNDNAATGGGVIVERNVRFSKAGDNSAFLNCEAGTPIYLMDDETTYLNNKEGQSARYPQGWNYYSYSNKIGLDLPVYFYSENDVGNHNYWHFVGTTPTLW